MADGRAIALVLGGAAAVGVAGLALAARRGGGAAATIDADTGDAVVGTDDGSSSGLGDAVTSVIASARSAAASAGIGSRVLDREYADGVHPDLQWLLDEYEAEGDDVMRVAHSLADGDGIPNGGLRTDAQLQQDTANAGLSAAASLQSTPHGRGAGLDLWPDGFNWHRDFASQPGMLERMQAFGAWAKTKTAPSGARFVYGGDWRKPDYDHVELSNWQGLPYPPPDYPSGSNG